MSSTALSDTHDDGYVEALRQFWDRSEYDRGYISNPFGGVESALLGLKRTAELLDRLGRPQDRYRILHVAGSKGKGSTCAFAASILTSAGKRTGCYTSPHLHSYRERIAIDGESIAEPAFATAWSRVLVSAVNLERERPDLGRVTAFELLTAMALDHFAAESCDAVVVEVGLGGTFDATNVVTPASTAITALDFEHVNILGPGMAEIAANKAGIVKPGIPLSTARLPDDAYPVIESAVRRNNSSWLLAGRDWKWQGSWQSFTLTGPWGTMHRLTSGLIGDHQVDNACLAIAGLWQMEKDLIDERLIRTGLANVHWPGRFEVVGSGGRTVVDGAHSVAAAEALAGAYAESFPGQRCVVILGVLRDKDPVSIALALNPVASDFITVTPPGPRGLGANELAAQLTAHGIPAHAVPEIKDAIHATGDSHVLITGSLVTVAAAREALGLATADPTFTP